MGPCRVVHGACVTRCGGSVDVPRGRRGVRVVGGAGGRAGVVRAARRRAGVGPARARAPPQAQRAPRAHQVRGAVAARGLLRHRRRRRRHQGDRSLYCRTTRFYFPLKTLIIKK